VPTLDDLLGDDFGTIGPPPPKPPVALPALEPEPVLPPHSIMADAFSALLAVEQGDPGAAPVRLTSKPAEPVITEDFLEQVVRRVLERIASGAAREIVSGLVSEVAERLVREEIERIRKSKQ
jgi:hypothetical protein